MKSEGKDNINNVWLLVKTKQPKGSIYCNAKDILETFNRTALYLNDSTQMF